MLVGEADLLEVALDLDAQVVGIGRLREVGGRAGDSGRGQRELPRQVGQRLERGAARWSTWALASEASRAHSSISRQRRVGLELAGTQQFGRSSQRALSSIRESVTCGKVIDRGGGRSVAWR